MARRFVPCRFGASLGNKVNVIALNPIRPHLCCASAIRARCLGRCSHADVRRLLQADGRSRLKFTEAFETSVSVPVTLSHIKDMTFREVMRELGIHADAVEGVVLTVPAAKVRPHVLVMC